MTFFRLIPFKNVFSLFEIKISCTKTGLFFFFYLQIRRSSLKFLVFCILFYFNLNSLFSLPILTFSQNNQNTILTFSFKILTSFLNLEAEHKIPITTNIVN